MVQLILAFAIGFVTAIILVPFYVRKSDSTMLKGDIKKIFFNGKGEIVDMTPPVELGELPQNEETNKEN